MARVTVEDCVTKVSNRFDLVLYAGHRARQIASGAELLVERDNDKNPVVSLREIAEDHVNPDVMKEEIIHASQKYVEVDEPEEDDMSARMAGTKDDAPAVEIPEKGIQEANLEQATIEEVEDPVIIEPEDE